MPTIPPTSMSAAHATMSRRMKRPPPGALVRRPAETGHPILAPAGVGQGPAAGRDSSAGPAPEILIRAGRTTGSPERRKTSSCAFVGRSDGREATRFLLGGRSDWEFRV